ncbi:MAG: hypothetical protein QHH06_10395 [Clostridiales bacterium]|nr:hypothetical protein [Eubacteriales bacterium]MDH7566875.1 hypothetical protein [Clostridiales bacterium]
MNKIENRAKKIAGKICKALDAVDEDKNLNRLVVTNILRYYEQHGLAEIIRVGWRERVLEVDRSGKG